MMKSKNARSTLSRRMSRSVPVLLLVMAAHFTTGCNKERGVEGTAAAAVATPVMSSVGAHTVANHVFNRTVEFPATVLARKQVTLLPRVPGDVLKIFVAEGDKVRKNQKLIQLNPRDYHLALRQARAQLAAARAGVDAATIGLDSIATKHRRFSALRKERAVSQSTFDDIDSGHRVTAAKVKGAQAQLMLARVAVDAAKTRLGDTIIRAPFDGQVGKRMVDEGARVQMMPPGPLLVIIDSARVKVQGAVGERDLPLLRTGAKAQVRIDALGSHPISGVVSRVEPVVDPRTRTATVRVDLDNAEGKIQVGMSAQIVVAQNKHEAPAVPDDAVVRTEVGKGLGVVFIINKDKVRRQEVTLGVRDGQLIEIVKGLEGGENIVRGGQDRLRDGQTVELTKVAGGEKR